MSDIVALLGMVAFLIVAAGVAITFARAREDGQLKQRRDTLTSQASHNEAFAVAALENHTERQTLFIDDQKCVAGIAPNALSIEGYPLFETKAVSEADRMTIPLPSILSIEWLESTQLKRVAAREREAVLVHHRRSPVARGLVGAALLGSVGGVLGAASGLNGKAELKHVERKTTKVVQTSGPRSIRLATDQPDRPVIRLRAPSASKTEEWFYRLRATIED